MKPLTETAPSTSRKSTPPRILIAGVGNVLRQDDGFGIEVVRHLRERGHLPPTVTLQETGIGGIHLVQELYNEYQALILVDVADKGKPPGTIFWLTPAIPDLREMEMMDQRDFLADMHYTNPSRALMLAKALNVLPPQVLILGCQPGAYSGFEMGLSAPVAGAVTEAAHQIEQWVEEFYATKSGESNHNGVNAKPKGE